MMLHAIGFTAATFLYSICVKAAYSANNPNVFYYWGQVSYALNLAILLLTFYLELCRW